jgi:hypothetical protein
LTSFLTDAEDLCEVLRVIQVDAYRPNHHLSLVMDDEEGQAIAYLSPEDELTHG